MTYLAQRITQGRKKSYGMYAKAASMAAAGRDLIHMELGSPHADTPLPVKQATVDALMAAKGCQPCSRTCRFQYRAARISSLENRHVLLPSDTQPCGQEEQRDNAAGSIA